MAVSRPARAQPHVRRLGDGTGASAPLLGEETDLVQRFGAGLSGVGLAVVIVDLEDATVRTVTKAACRLLGLSADQIIGRPWTELVAPVDRRAAMAALEAMRTGGIDFYRAHRHPVGTAGRSGGLCSWVRRIELEGKPYAIGRYVDSYKPPGPWPTGPELFVKAVAIAITDSRSIVRTGTVSLDSGAGFSIQDLLGVRLVPPAEMGNLVSLADWRAAGLEGASVAFPASVPNLAGAMVELEAIATALAEPAGWLVVLLQMDPPGSLREAALEDHLWRIAAEVEASGILQRAGSTPGLSLQRIPEAAGLTPRQWEVLRRIVAGQRVPTIAAELYVSQSTIRNHLSAIFERFDVHSQAQLLDRLVRTDTPSIATDGLSMV